MVVGVFFHGGHIPKVFGVRCSVFGVRPPFFAPVPLNTRQKLVSSRSTYLGEEESGLRSTYPSALMNHPSECDVSSGSSSYPEETWIQWFCNLTGNPL